MLTNLRKVNFTSWHGKQEHAVPVRHHATYGDERNYSAAENCWSNILSISM